jgi:hypothetical protein
MAITGESVVARGAEGTGAAQVFHGNPLRGYFNIRASQAKAQAVKSAEEAKAKQERDKKMMEIISVSPEKTFQPFNEQVLAAANQHRKLGMEYLGKGGDPASPNFLMANQAGWEKVNDVARRGVYIKDKIDKTMSLIEKDPYLKAEYYYPKIFDQYMDPYGNGKPIDNIDVNKIENVYTEDPMGFDIGKYTKDFMGSLKENVFNWKKQKNTNMGLEADDVEVKVKGALYTPDETTASGVREDANGNPIINATPDFVNSFTSNENAKRFIQKYADQNGMDVKQAIESFVSPQGGFQKQLRPIYRTPSQWFMDYQNAARGGISPDKVPQATRRWENIHNVVNAFYDPDGNRMTSANPQARAALGYLKKNVKLGGGDVLDADIVPGSNAPGSTSIMGMNVPNNASDRVVFKVKFGTRGQAKPIDINLSDEGAGAQLNALFEQAKSEGKFNIGFDQLADWKGVNPSEMYKGREGMAQVNEQLKAMENETVDNKWLKGEGAEEFVGKIHNGKEIEDAKPNVEPGVFGSGSGVLGMGGGTFKGWDVKYKDGTYGTINAERGELADVYKGLSTKKKSAASPDGKIKVRNKDGKIGHIPADQLDEALKQGFEQVD